MQSIVSSSMATQSGKVETLNHLLSRSAFQEDFDSQCETGNRMPVLPGISLDQQLRRMRRRPDSLAQIQVADCNRFAVFSDALELACNHPSMFSSLQTCPNDNLSELPMLNGDKTSNKQQTLQLGFDFADRTWPAYEPAMLTVRKQSATTQNRVIENSAAQTASVSWNLSADKPRISAVYDKVPSIIDNPERLRALVDEARQRDVQRITAKLRIISPRRPDDRIGRVIDAALEAVAKLRFQFNIVRTYFGHANNRENFMIMDRS